MRDLFIGWVQIFLKIFKVETENAISYKTNELYGQLRLKVYK